MKVHSKEALKKLNSMPTCSECELYGSCFDKPLCNELYNTIKQDLDRLEKLEKVIEILKNKQVNIDMLTLSFEIDIGREAYNACMEVPYKLLTQEQYNLLKEVIGNEV